MRNTTFEPARPLDTEGEDSQVIESANAETQRAVYLAWCQEHGVDPAEQLLG
jgi:hypothetical protein